MHSRNHPYTRLFTIEHPNKQGKMYVFCSDKSHHFKSYFIVHVFYLKRRERLSQTDTIFQATQSAITAGSAGLLTAHELEMATDSDSSDSNGDSDIEKDNDEAED